MNEFTNLRNACIKFRNDLSKKIEPIILPLINILANVLNKICKK